MTLSADDPLLVQKLIAWLHVTGQSEKANRIQKALDDRQKAKQ